MIAFRAGKLLESNGNLVADPRKGTIIIQKEEDGTISLKWKERSTAREIFEDSFIVLPGEALFIGLMNQNSGQCFAVKFINTKVRFFFWLQEPIASNYGPEFIDLINKVFKYELEPYYSVPLIDANMRVPSLSIPDISQTSKSKKLNVGTKFSKLLQIKTLDSVLDDPESVKKCLEHLPSGRPQTRGELILTIRSPQFQQTLTFLDDALALGDLRSLVAELGLDSLAGAPSENLDFFLEEMRRVSGRKE